MMTNKPSARQQAIGPRWWISALVVGVAATLIPAFAAASLRDARAVERAMTRATERANAMLAKMTREEKIAVAAGNAAGVPRLGIPPQVFGDGPNGVGHGAAGVTAFPNAQVVAAATRSAF